MKKSKKAIVLSNEERDDRLRRTAALTFQTSILSSFSILVSGIATFISFLSSALKLANHYEAADRLKDIYECYFFSPQYFVVVVSSNAVFIVHCCYSMLYREAMYETHAALKASLKRILDSICRLKCKKNSVQPEAKF